MIVDADGWMTKGDGWWVTLWVHNRKMEWDNRMGVRVVPHRNKFLRGFVIRM